MHPLGLPTRSYRTIRQPASRYHVTLAHATGMDSYRPTEPRQSSPATARLSLGRSRQTASTAAADPAT